MRQMTATLHIAPDTKQELDKLIPKSIGKERITYDDFLQGVLLFFSKDNLAFNERDITEMIIAYKNKQLSEMLVA